MQLSNIEMEVLIRGLQSHQIELEKQNEELIVAKEQAEIASVKYGELFDFAPLGYFVLSKEGEIVELNHLRIPDAWQRTDAFEEQQLWLFCF